MSLNLRAFKIKPTIFISDSVAYRFGKARPAGDRPPRRPEELLDRGEGLMTFTFPEKEWPDTKRDVIALGLMTSQRDAVLFRIVSGSSNDFIEMELVEC